MIQLTNTVKHLIIINVLVFLATIALNEQLFDVLAMHFIYSPLFEPWQLVTHIFMHGSVQHILFNMIGLWMFGSSVEELVGKEKFLIIYFVAGIGAVLFSLGIDYVQYQYAYNNVINTGISEVEFMKFVHEGAYTNNADVNTMVQKYNTSLVGASGALYGIMVAFGVLLPRAKMGLMFFIIAKF